MIQIKQEIINKFTTKVVTESNIIADVNKTSAIFIKLLSHFKFNFKFRKVENLNSYLFTDIQKKYKIMVNTSKTKADIIDVNIYYTKEKELQEILKVLDVSNKPDGYCGFIVTRELFKVLLGHTTYTHYNKYKYLVTSKLDEKYAYLVLVIASNLYIEHIVAGICNDNNVQFDTSKLKYLDDILLKNINSYPRVIRDVVEQLNIILSVSTNLYKDDVILYSDKLLEYDEHTIFIAEVLETTINSEVRGFTSSPIFKTALASKNTVNTDWIKELKKHISRFTYERTNDIESTWGKYNNTYKNIFTAPGANCITHKLKFVLSIDQSGSMTNEDIALIQEVMKVIAKDTAEATIILHDTEIADIIDIVDLEEDELKKKLIESTHRVCTGGTSHKHVFEYLSTLTNLEDILYISFSDNYSDIEEAYKKYRKYMNKLDCIFLSTSDKKVNINSIKNIKIL